jgi:hypothetical protein
MSHLTGEHAEAHMFLTKMHRGHSLEGYYEGDMFFGAQYVKGRHDLLAAFLGGHGTPLEIEAKLIRDYPLVEPTMEALKNSLGVLLSRCAYCADRHERFR